MGNFLDAVKTSLKNTWCGYTYQDFVIAGLVAGSPLILSQPVGSLTVAGTVTKGLTRLRDASDQWCDKGESGGGGAGGTWDMPPANFEGGQCEGDLYRFTLLYQIIYPTGALEAERTVSVTIAGAVTEVGISQDFPPQIFKGSRYHLYAKNAAGETTSNELAKNLSATADGVQQNSLTTSNLTNPGNECGEPDPVVPPIDKIDDAVDIDYLDENDNPVSFPSNPVEWFPPCYSPTGVKLPFKISSPLGDICGKLNFGQDSFGAGTNITPEIEVNQCRDNELAVPSEPQKDYFELSPPLGGGASSPDSELVGTAVGSFDPETEVPILGAFIVAARENPNKLEQTKIIGSQSQEFPPLLFPDIGTIRFLCLVETENGISFSYSEAIRIQQVQAYIPCPSAFGAAAVEVSWRPGWTGTYQEARRKNCCDACKNSDNPLPNELDRCA